MFLVSDGTLTDLLEAAVREPIALKKLAVSVSVAKTSVEAINVVAGDRIMERKILLYGTTSVRNYIYAETLLAVDRLPQQFGNDLVALDAPLGRLWSEHRLETRKELLRVSRVAAGDLAQHFSVSSVSDLLIRKYRLISGGKPIMAITEYFPAELEVSN
jgi:chorismate-pyruvate lyase